MLTSPPAAFRPDFSLRLADHFPIVAAPCKEAAARFFFCFTENSQQRPGETAFVRSPIRPLSASHPHPDGITLHRAKHLPARCHTSIADSWHLLTASDVVIV